MNTPEVLTEALSRSLDGTPFDVVEFAFSVADELDKLGYTIVPSDREPLPDRARARRGDPDTATQAADSIGDMNERHRATLWVADTFGHAGFTYDELEYRYNRRRDDGHDLPAQLPQSLRSRCVELRRAGWIEATGQTDTNDRGRPCKVWRTVNDVPTFYP